MPPFDPYDINRFKRDEDAFDKMFTEPMMLGYFVPKNIKDGPISNPPCTIEQLLASCGMKEEF